jgi:hypothetical protein
VDVGIDERRGEQAAAGIEDVVAVRVDGPGRGDLGDAVAIGPNVLQRDVGARGRMDARVSDEQARRGSLPATPGRLEC